MPSRYVGKANTEKMLELCVGVERYLRNPDQDEDYRLALWTIKEECRKFGNQMEGIEFKKRIFDKTGGMEEVPRKAPASKRRKFRDSVTPSEGSTSDSERSIGFGSESIDSDDDDGNDNEATGDDEPGEEIIDAAQDRFEERLEDITIEANREYRFNEVKKAFEAAKKTKNPAKRDRLLDLVQVAAGSKRKRAVEDNENSD